ncbi:MAG: hypothetical protein ACOCYR_04730, partial [Erythrobacter sp.]
MPAAALALAALAAVVLLVERYSGGLPSQVVRAIHVGFLCLLAGGMLAVHRGRSTAGRALAWGLGAAGFAVGLYQWALYEPLLLRAGDPSFADLVIGTAAIGLL